VSGVPFNLDFHEQVVRIDRMIAESRKFAAEQNKLAEEADKFRRERWWLPVVALSGGVLGFLTFVAHLLGH
jgi:hypothetical protein